MLKRSAVLFAGLAVASSLAGCCCGMHNRCNPCGGGAYYAPSPAAGGCSPCQPSYGGMPMGAYNSGADFSGMAAVQPMSIQAASPAPSYASTSAPSYATPVGMAPAASPYPATASLPLQSLPTY